MKYKYFFLTKEISYFWHYLEEVKLLGRVINPMTVVTGGPYLASVSQDDIEL